MLVSTYLSFISHRLPHALQIPELLQYLFSFLQPADLHSCCQVNHMWRKIIKSFIHFNENITMCYRIRNSLVESRAFYADINSTVCRHYELLVFICQEDPTINFKYVMTKEWPFLKCLEHFAKWSKFGSFIHDSCRLFRSPKAQAILQDHIKRK